MSSISSVTPRIKFSPDGLELPTEQDVLDGVISDIDMAFGTGLNPALDTPQGQLASSLTAIIADKNDQIAWYCNQVDPLYAEDRMQDAIGRIYFMERKPALPTIAHTTVRGIYGTVIPAGSRVADDSGNIYEAMDDYTIGISDVYHFRNQVTGPIPCPRWELTTIVDAIPGWTEVDNPFESTLGTNIETRGDFERRRRASVYRSASGSCGAIYAAVFALDYVSDVYVVDNPTHFPTYVGATEYEMRPHSVLVTVVGGIDTEIAQAIWRNKDIGCDMMGETTVWVEDDSGYSPPRPQYEITFLRPEEVEIGVLVTLIGDEALPADVNERIEMAVYNRFHGLDGTTRERIGSNVMASRYYDAVANAVAGIAIKKIEIRADSPVWEDYVHIGVEQVPTLLKRDIEIEYGE